MRFQDLTREDQALLNTDFGSMDKEAADMVKMAGDCYSYGHDKLAAETADGLDKLAAEAEAAEKDEKDEDEGEEKKAAADEFGAIVERGYFDGLAKLGSARHGDPMHYFWPFIEQKIAEAGAQAALVKAASLLKAAGDDPEGHYVRRTFLGNPISSAIEAEKGKKMKAFGSALGHQAKNQAVGALGAGALGAGVGALAGGKGGALVGGLGGAVLGNAAGALKGTYDRKASEIHGRHSKNKKDESK